MNSTHPLERLRARLSAPEDGDFDPDLYAHFSVVEHEGLLYVDFSGSPLDEPFAELCRTLRGRDVAESLASIVLRCPDDGANGACNWNLTELLESDSIFAALQLFSVQQTAPADHNRMTVAADYDEAGMLGRLMRKARYDTQNFIGNLADSNTFPEGCTPFADYRRLFQSKAFATVRAFTWRNPICSPEEIAELWALRQVRDLQFKVVRFSSEYVPP
jgi:hypothetical protein